MGPSLSTCIPCPERFTSRLALFLTLYQQPFSRYSHPIKCFADDIGDPSLIPAEGREECFRKGRTLGLIHVTCTTQLTLPYIQTRTIRSLFEEHINNHPSFN